MRTILSCQMTNFIIAGSIATLLHWLSMAVFVYFEMEPTRATLIGSIVGAALNYLLQRQLAFRNAGPHSRTLLRYVSSCLFAWLCNVIIFYWLNSVWNMPVSLSQIVTTGLVASLNFVVYQRIVFHDKTF